MGVGGSPAEMGPAKGAASLAQTKAGVKEVRQSLKGCGVNCSVVENEKRKKGWK